MDNEPSTALVGGTPPRDYFRAPAMRPVMPTRGPAPAEDVTAKNPFTALNEANKAHEELNDRLEKLVEKLTGAAPRFAGPGENPVEKLAGKPGLLQLSRAVATMIGERSRHGVSLIDMLEENLQ